MNSRKWLKGAGWAMAGMLMAGVAHGQTESAAIAATAPVFTQEMADALSSNKVALDTVWVLITAFLVFFMNLGFAMVESGLCRAKNAVNILAKNFIVFAISSIAFWVLGWGLMFGDGNGILGLKGLHAFG